MFKENLMSALKRAVDLHNSGDDDNSAIVKSAAEYEFNPDQTQRLVETYNTAKTICFYKTAGDRTQAFTLADGGAVAKNLFKDNLGPKAADARLHDYSCYDLPMDINEVGTLTVLDEVKAASQSEINSEPLNVHQLDSRLKAIDDIKLAAQKADEAANMADYGYGEIINDICRSVGIEKLAKFSAAVQCQQGCDMTSQVLKDITARFPAGSASDIPDFTMFDVQHPDIMAKYAEACDYFLKYAMFRATQAELSTEAEKQAGYLLGPMTVDDSTDFFTEGVKTMILRGDVKYAGPRDSGSSMLMDPVGIVGGGVSQGLQGTAKSVVTGALDKTLDAGNRESKKLTDNAKNLHRKFILEKMITTDPILKGVPEEDVIRAYQSIVQLAPEVSLNEEVTRSILRTATNAAAISPYDAKSLVDLDLDLVKSQLVQQGGKEKQLKDMREAGK